MLIKMALWLYVMTVTGILYNQNQLIDATTMKQLLQGNNLHALRQQQQFTTEMIFITKPAIITGAASALSAATTTKTAKTTTTLTMTTIPTPTMAIAVATTQTSRQTIEPITITRTSRRFSGFNVRGDKEVIGDVVEDNENNQNDKQVEKQKDKEEENEESEKRKEQFIKEYKRIVEAGKMNNPNKDKDNDNENNSYDAEQLSLLANNSIRMPSMAISRRIMNNAKRTKSAIKRKALIQKLLLLRQHNNRLQNSENFQKFNATNDDRVNNYTSGRGVSNGEDDGGADDGGGYSLDDIFDDINADDVNWQQQQQQQREQEKHQNHKRKFLNNNSDNNNSNSSRSSSNRSNYNNNNNNNNYKNFNKENKNKQTVKFSKYKANDGDSLTIDFKQNLQRLLSSNNNKNYALNNIGLRANDDSKIFENIKTITEHELQATEQQVHEIEDEGKEEHEQNIQIYENYSKISDLRHIDAVNKTKVKAATITQATKATRTTTTNATTIPTILRSMSTATPTPTQLANVKLFGINNNNLTPSTPLGRRHIVPEKLQYTHEITIKQGRLKGIRRTFQTNTGLRDVDHYLGLPYAEAPIGNRRFMPPGTPLPWSGLRMAHHLPPVCPQNLPDLSKTAGIRLSKGRYMQWIRLLTYMKNQSEDCLYLNVYVPSESDITAALFQRKFLYPVVVYIHGESFEWNSGNAYDGSVLASYGDVIVVTINYRLGVLGFMRPSLNENTVANFGLLDQIAALHWIQENIAYFGGDKSSVTLMGHSTGAACINYLMISPVAAGLFHRAILMSGSATSDWASTNTSLQQTMQIANGVNCSLKDNTNANKDDRDDDMLKCLRQKSYQDILRVPIIQNQFSTSLGPIVDGHVIPDQPYKVMSQYTEYFGRYDLLFGITESESYHALGAAMLEEGLRENERDNLLHFYMQNRFDVRPDLALAATLKKYSDMYTNPIKATKLEHRDVVLDILSDARVVSPLLQTGLFHADANRHNYMYVFGHNSFGGPHASLPHSIAGEELPFIFGAPLATVGPYHGTQYNAQEKLLAEAVMTYWCNFIKTGNPKAPWKGTFINLHTLEWDRYDLDWPEFNKRTQAYMNIGIPPSIGYKYRQIYMNFWNKELPDELNQIANMQKQPIQYHKQYQNTQVPQLVTDNANEERRHRGNSDIITGHLNKFGLRHNGNEDPIRTLKLLLQEPQTNPNYMEMDKNADNSNSNNLQKDLEQKYHKVQQQQVTISKQDSYYGNPVETINAENINTNDDHDNGDAAATGAGADAVNSIIYGTKHSNMKSTSTTNNNSKNANNNNNNNDNNKNEQELVYGKVTQMSSEPEDSRDEQVAKSETTLHLLIGLIVVFIILNIVIYSTYLLQKRRKTNTIQRKLGGCVGGIGGGAILSYDGTTDDELKRSKPTTQYGDGDESYIIDILRKSNTYEPVKTERSPMNGYKITRQLSCSTVDTHTKVCEWMDGKVMISNSSILPRRPSSYKSSKKSSSFSSLVGKGQGNRTGSGGGSFGKPTHKVSVAVDATSQGRGNSVLEQEPIEITKMKADGRNIIICQEVEVTDQELLSPQESLNSSYYCLTRQHSTATEPCDVDLCQPLHKYSRSDPIDMCYNIQTDRDHNIDETITSFITPDNDNDPLDINVTSKNELEDLNEKPALTHEQQLSVIKKRKYPKVLPPLQLGEINGNDSPPMTQDLFTTYKRNSLPPHNFYKQPPLPPPRTVATLGRRVSHNRPNSNILASSPLMLACDCTEEDEEPEISKNTLIVGSLVPNQSANENYYSTLKRERTIKLKRDDDIDSNTNSTSCNMNTHNKSNADSSDKLVHIERNTVNDTIAWSNGTRKEQTEHLTEKVYNIKPVTVNKNETVNITDNVTVNVNAKANETKVTTATADTLATTAIISHRPTCYASAPTTPNVLIINTPQMLYPSTPSTTPSSTIGYNLMNQRMNDRTGTGTGCGSLQALYAQSQKKSQIPRMIAEKSYHNCPTITPNETMHSIIIDKFKREEDISKDNSLRQMPSRMMLTQSQQSLSNDMTASTINVSLNTSNPSLITQTPQCIQKSLDVQLSSTSDTIKKQYSLYQHDNQHCNLTCTRQLQPITTKEDMKKIDNVNTAIAEGKTKLLRSLTAPVTTESMTLKPLHGEIFSSNTITDECHLNNSNPMQTTCTIVSSSTDFTSSPSLSTTSTISSSSSSTGTVRTKVQNKIKKL